MRGGAERQCDRAPHPPPEARDPARLQRRVLEPVRGTGYNVDSGEYDTALQPAPLTVGLAQ